MMSDDLLSAEQQTEVANRAERIYRKYGAAKARRKDAIIAELSELGLTEQQFVQGCAIAIWHDTINRLDDE